MKGVSLFSSAGIAETYLRESGINISVANELVEERASLHTKIYPDCNMITGDILNKKIFQNIIASSGKKIDFLIASPPCQGMSVAGKNRNINQMLSDERIFLVFRIIEFIEAKFKEMKLIRPGRIEKYAGIRNKLAGHYDKQIADILRELGAIEYDEIFEDMKAMVHYGQEWMQALRSIGKLEV